LSSFAVASPLIGGALQDYSWCPLPDSNRHSLSGSKF